MLPQEVVMFEDIATENHRDKEDHRDLFSRYELKPVSKDFLCGSP